MGKQVSIRKSECVFLALFVHHKKLLRRIMLLSVAFLTVPFFPPYNLQDFVGKKVTENEMCVLFFSTTFV